MSIPCPIFSNITNNRCRALFRVSVIGVFLAAAAPIAVAAADEPSDAEELRQAVRDLSEQVEILRNEVRKLAVSKSGGGTDASAGSGGGNGGSAAPGKAGSAQPPSAASRNRPSTARYRRRDPERQPYYVYPPVWYAWPNYNTPGYVYPYNYQMYYGVPFYPNSVMVNPYKGLWFNP